MLRKALLLALVCVPLAARAEASPVNLLANGSFESGLAGWSTSGTFITFPPTLVTTGATCCFGEFVPVDSLVAGSPDAGGTKAIYFVDDLAHEFLTQSIFLTAGSYEIGFDTYVPFNGFANPGDALFKGTIAGVQLANFSVKTQSTPGAWLNFSSVANILADGVYNVSFDYQTFGGASADVLVDRAYVVASTRGGGTDIPAVPEPATLLLVGTGIVATVRRRLRNA